MGISASSGIKPPNKPIITFIIVPHAQEPWDEASLWGMSGECSIEMIRAIVYESPPTQAVMIVGRAKEAFVHELVANLSRVLAAAGVKVITEIQPDD
jgi:hypothetical protein